MPFRERQRTVNCESTREPGSSECGGTGILNISNSSRIGPFARQQSAVRWGVRGSLSPPLAAPTGSSDGRERPSVILLSRRPSSGRYFAARTFRRAIAYVAGIDDFIWPGRAVRPELAVGYPAPALTH